MYGDVTHAAVERLLSYLSSEMPLPATSRDAARLVGVSHSHLHHLLRRELGRSYLDLVRETRARRARQALAASPHSSITEVADQVGYTTRTMCRDFLKVFGATPSQLRRGHLGPQWARNDLA
jgi:AraC-like DNA-binding protein